MATGYGTTGVSRGGPGAIVDIGVDFGLEKDDPVYRTQIEDLFSKLDINDDGTLTRAELEPLSARLGGGLLDKMDEDDDEEITRAEFIRYFLRN